MIVPTMSLDGRTSQKRTKEIAGAILIMVVAELLFLTCVESTCFLYQAIDIR